jgi:hypothetical protein
MNVRPKLILKLSAAFVSIASCAAFAQTQASSAPVATPDATSTVTTTGGTANKLAKFSGSNTIVNSILYDNGSEIGIGTTSPSATLTVDGTTTLNGNSTVNGQLVLPATGTATPTKAFTSQFIKFNTSAYNSSSGSAVPPRFQLQAEVTNNDTASPNATLNVLASANSNAPTETGLYINTNGTIHFASGQTFPVSGGSLCIATGGGFGTGGTTFVAPAFAVPGGGKCASWSGFTKTASTVVLMTNGSGCVSTDGKKMTLSVSSADPNFVGAGNVAWDYIQLTRPSTSGSFTGGSDQGEFSGSAEQISCTSSLLQLNENND